MICLLRPVSQATLYIICFPRIVVVTYMNVDIHSTCLIMTLSCLKSPLSYALYTNLSHLTTNLLLYVLFCVFPVCYDVRLSHLNKYYLLTYLLISNVVPRIYKVLPKLSPGDRNASLNRLYLSPRYDTTTIRLRFDGRSTAYPRSLRSR